MKKKRRTMAKRVISFLMAIMLMVGMLPANAFAMEGGSFVFVVEAGGKLVVAPEFVTYTGDKTVGEALADSGHDFVGLEDGWITEIDGVVGNYSRSDQNGDYNLSAPASNVEFYRICEDEESTPSKGLQQLMTAMADYSKKDADVKEAAKEAYETAYNQFVGLDSDSAKMLAEALMDAVSDYEGTQNGTKYDVTFADGSNVCVDYDIAIKNTYGKKWTDDGDGIISLPMGTYSFNLSKDGLGATGTISVTENTTVLVSMPKESWLNKDAIRISGSYGTEDNEENKFSDDEYELDAWNDRNLVVPVSDTFTGKIYTYAEYDKELLDKVPVLTAIYPSAKTGEEITQDIPFESLNSGMSNVLKRGSVGNTVIYRISSVGSDGYTYSQDYSVEFARIPSLTGIKVQDQREVDQTATTSFDGNVTEYTYKVLDSVTSVIVKAAPLESDYDVTINGKDGTNGVTVELSEEGETTIDVLVTAGDYSNTYTIKILPGEGKELSFITKRADVTLEVVNENGEVMPCEKFREGASGNRYQYVLVPGETYSYVATAGNYYHIADEFTMEDVADSTISVDVPTDDWLKELAFGTKTSKKYKDTLPLDSKFDAANHRYQVKYVDTEHNAYVWVNAEANVEIEAIYNQVFASDLYHGKEYVIELTSEKATGTQIKRFLMDENPIENTVTLRLSKEVNGVKFYQDYFIDFGRELTLKDVAAKCAGVNTALVQEGGVVGFDSNVKEYSVTVSMAAGALDLVVACYDEKLCYGEDSVGYRVSVDGVDVTESMGTTIALDGTMNTQNVSIVVENDKAPNGTSEYILHILKSPPVETVFEITPENAVLAVYESMSGERLWADENNTFQFCEGYNYNYTLTAYGYVSKSGTLQVTRDENKALVVIDGEEIHTVTESEDKGGTLTINWDLAEAEANSSINTDIVAEWENFRGDETNNAITDASIPISAGEGTLYWANKIGKGYSSEAVGSPILVDGDLVTYAGAKIYRVDTLTGEIKVTGDMDHKSAHATTPPSYAEGMVFVALTDGTVQAFNAETLESLWIYRDPLGGQPICPLTIRNGYLYTGFWNSETGDANFVCLTITDEDNGKSDEEKCVSWYYTTKGGYYWAGAYASDEFVMVGTDDGTSKATSQTSKLLLFDPITGKLLDSWEELKGDVRSTVVYDSVTNAYYFTSKGGGFYSVQVEKDGDGYKFVNKWSVDLVNGTNGTPMSTCSPTVYNGRAYVGVSGASQFGAYSGHNITVIDLREKEIAYSVQTQGYPQTSGLLTTAYEEASGYVYIYFFDNMTPGKLRVIRDKAGQASADYVTTEGSYNTAYALFTPTGEQAQYAICSPIVDEYGTVYFKNDSAHMMAFGSAIKKIEVTKNPDKMIYAEGENFDATGMVVTATYANGKTRDITKYVTWDLKEVVADKTLVTISFPYVMYHNEENGTSMTSGVVSTTPVTTLQLAIGENEPEKDILLGDVNGDGEVNTLDAGLITSYYYGDIELDENQLVAADVNGDGEADTQDSGLVISYYYGDIDHF